MKPRSRTSTRGAGVCLTLLSSFIASAIPVTYQVNLGVQIALGNFNPVTDTVFISGTFSTPNWLDDATDGATNYILAPSVGNPNIYVGTFNIVNPPGSFENHKFVINPNHTFGSLNWENVTGGGNRFFQVPATATNLPVVYFRDQSSVPSTTVPVTFQVDMAVQTSLGNLDPGNGDVVLAAGDFNPVAGSSTWATDFILTNIPTTTVYSGTWAVTNLSPGATVNHKYIINSFNLGMVWEANGLGPNGAQNRQFVLPSTATNLPVVFFNNLTNASSLITTQITFKVNLAAQIARGTFDPNIGTVFVAGDAINNWSPIASPLTQSPTNSSVWSGTIGITNTVGAPVNYKFVLNGGGTWEDNGVGPGGANDRQFIFPNTATVLPDVYFNNLNNLGARTIGPVTGGQVTVSWTAGPLVRLQTNSTPTGTWGDVPGSEGLGTMGFAVGAGSIYFRLIGP